MLIGETEAKALREHLEKYLDGPVHIDLFTRTQACESCEETRILLEEVAALSNEIVLAVHDAEPEIVEVPTIAISGRSKGRVRYVGAPGGYEIAVLIQTLIDVSRGDSRLSDNARAALEGLSKDVVIRVFVTPTCPFCPSTAQLAHRMAVESRRVTAEVVEIDEFPELADRYQVQGVPKTVIGEIDLVGAQSEQVMLAAVLGAAA